MYSLKKRMKTGFYTLLIVGTILVAASFVDISDVLGNYSLEQKWDVALEYLNDNMANASSAKYVNIVNELPTLVKDVEGRLFVDGNDLASLKAGISAFRTSNTDKKAIIANIIGLSRKTLTEASQRELLFLKIMIITLIITAAMIMFLLIFIPQRRFLRLVDSVSDKLSDIEMDKISRIENSPFVELKNLINSFNILVGKFETYKSVLDLTERSKTIGDLTEEFYKGLKKIVKFNRVAFSTIDGKKVVAEVALSDSKEIHLKPPFVQRLTEGSLDGVVQSKKPRVIDDLEKYFETHPESEATKLLLEEGMRSSLTFPIYVDGKGKGFLFLDSFDKNGFSETDLKKFEMIQAFISLAYQKTSLTRDLIVGTVTSFTKLVEKKDNETGLHLVRMAAYSRLIAEELLNEGGFKEVDPRYIQQLHLEAPLHDIGKVGIPDKILLKPGKLDYDEFEVMKTHSEIGSDILEGFDEMFKTHGRKFLEMGSKIARHHHEKWDGSGYPDGLIGAEIPLCARIVAIADVFDALTSKRHYKEAFDYEKSLKIVLDSSGTHFDPDIVTAFVNAQPGIRNIYERFGEA